MEIIIALLILALVAVLIWALLPEKRFEYTETENQFFHRMYLHELSGGNVQDVSRKYETYYVWPRWKS